MFNDGIRIRMLAWPVTFPPAAGSADAQTTKCNKIPINGFMILVTFELGMIKWHYDPEFIYMSKVSIRVMYAELVAMNNMDKCVEIRWKICAILLCIRFG